MEFAPCSSCYMKLPWGRGLVWFPSCWQFWFVCFFLLEHNSAPNEIMVLCRSGEGIGLFCLVGFCFCLHSWGFPRAFFPPEIWVVLHMLPAGKKDPLDTLGSHCYRVRSMFLPHVGNLTIPDLSWVLPNILFPYIFPSFGGGSVWHGPCASTV